MLIVFMVFLIALCDSCCTDFFRSVSVQQDIKKQQDIKEQQDIKKQQDIIKDIIIEPKNPNDFVIFLDFFNDKETLITFPKTFQSLCVKKRKHVNKTIKADEEHVFIIYTKECYSVEIYTNFGIFKSNKNFSLSNDKLNVILIGKYTNDENVEIFEINNQIGVKINEEYINEFKEDKILMENIQKIEKFINELKSAEIYKIMENNTFENLIKEVLQTPNENIIFKS